MGIRFQKRVKILPGVTLNLGKSGGSVSFGGRGAKITVGPKGTRKTVGIPGTGISYTEYKKHGPRNNSVSKGQSASGWAFYAIIAIIVFWIIYSVVSKLL